MDADAGAQVVAAQSFLHHRDLPPLARKRDPPWNQASRLPQPNWSPGAWRWDPAAFSARPAADGGTLALKLGAAPPAAVAAAAAPPAVRPAKRVRSDAPSGASYPMCQVDDCRADLSGAKDYHRRHKVCEAHSKTTKALVAAQLQRFCQQCSRFHPLPEFDEGKRSCRRRLAGHNRRRRKTQPEDASPRLLLSGGRESTVSGGLDILNLLSILARLQGNGAEKGANSTVVSDKDQLISIINKINSIPSTAASGRSKVDGEFDLNVPQAPVAAARAPESNATPSGPPTMDLLTVLSSALNSKPETATSHSQGSSACTAEAREKNDHVEPCGTASADNQINASVFPSRIATNRCALQSSWLAAEHPVSQVRTALPLQLFSSTDDDSPPKAYSFRKYLSSESSNPMEERSPSSSPPIVRKFFPTNSDAERNDRCEDVAMVEASTSQRWSSSFELAKESERRVHHGVVGGMLYQGGYTSSSSGSDHSPSSSNSDAHDKTGRIMFKLFDKSPGDLPGTLRTQIFNWLSHIPSEMESYIRPGCVVLSLYLSMPPVVWEQLKEDLSQRVQLLLDSDGSQFWRSGRFLVYTDRRLASHKDGIIRSCKSWKSWSSPELMSVSPLAVVSGKETPILVRGRNLTVPGTKIHCTFMGGYTSKEVPGSMYEGTIYDDSSLESISFPGGPPGFFGRCFIEVEHGFKGNSFPLIVANERICQELRGLEPELEYGIVDCQGQDTSPKSREDILHFLNELGWLFQRKNLLSSISLKDFSCTRFKYLLLFAVERDWSILTAKLLDMLAERSIGDVDLEQESLNALSEIQLLSRAVKRKCREMVDLLLGYSVRSGDGSNKIYIFPPNSAGPGGLTPLHIAASCKGCLQMVDALTNDPQEIGLSCWSSCTDDNGQSPFNYAAMASNHSYNELVERKLSDRKNCQVSIVVHDENALDKSWIVKEPGQGAHPHSVRPPCLRCAATEFKNLGGTMHSQGLLRRPYIHSMLAIAAVCVCVCLFLRGAPQLGSVAPFKWENVQYGPR